MSDFDDWVKKQQGTGQAATPKTAAPKPTGGSFDSWVRGEKQQRKPAPVLPSEPFGAIGPYLDVMDTSSRDAYGRPISAQEGARRKSAADPLLREDLAAKAETGREAKKKADWEAKPLLERKATLAHEAFAKGGLGVSKMARQALGAGLGAAGAVGTGKFEMADFPAWRQREEESAKELERRRLSRPAPSFGEEVGAGILEGTPAAAGALGLGALTGGGALGTMAIGGGMSAAGADWRDPKRAALETGVGAVAPVIGGKIGQRIGGAVAGRLARPAAQATARGGGELLGGGLGNVGGAVAMGETQPRELARQFAVGAGLSAPGAATAARRPSRLPESNLPVVGALPEATGAASSQYGLNLSGMGQAMGGALRQTLRDSVAKRGRLPSVEQNSEVGRAYEAAVANGAPRTVATLDQVFQSLQSQNPALQSAQQRAAQSRVATTGQTGPLTAPLPRTPGGAIIVPRSSLPSRKLLPPGRPEDVPTEQLDARGTGRITVPQPDAPPTGRIEYPDAPETQRVPVITPEMIAAENAPTRGLPQRPIRQTKEVSRQPDFVRPTAEIPRQQPAPEKPASAPVAQARPITARPPTERLPVPKVTDENVDQLRQRQEELSRLAYDRRGDFTGDLRDEHNQINAAIREYENQRAPRELAPLPGREERMTPPPEERGARRAALQPRTGPLPETLTEGRKVTQEVQIPGQRAAETFISREDARQGHFERFDDAELVAEIARLEDVRNQSIRGRSRLTPEQLEANRFDLKIATTMQKERRRLQRQMGMEGAEGIQPRTPGRTFTRHPETPQPETPPARKIQHSKFGEVTEAPDQSGVRRGQLRVTDADGAAHIIRNPRTKGGGNREAAFVKTGPAAQPAAAMQRGKGEPPNIVQRMARIARSPESPVSITKLRAEFPEMSKADFDKAMTKLNEEGRISLHRHDAPGQLSETDRANLVQIGKDYFNAATIRQQVRGFGLGALFPRKQQPPKPGQQPLFKGEKPPRTGRKQISETAGGVQTVAQLGNPRFVVRNVIQHVAFGKQERTATRIAAALDWAISKGTGKGRQVFAPRGSDLASYIRNWGKAITAYKKGEPLPGRPNADYITADANKLDKGVRKVMNWINEIPDAANWQTRFEQSLQSIVGNQKRLKAPLDMDGAIDQAMMEANKASLRDPNFISSALLSLKQGLNKLSSPVFGSDKFGAGDFILKYAQTPGALLRRGLERSPLGLFQVAKEAATPGPFRRRNTLLALSRVAEGAATGAGLGAALAAAGVLVGPEEESRSGKAMEREEGVRGYSLNASALLRRLSGDFDSKMQEGDQLYSIDWLQPWAMNLSAGAAVYNLYEQGKLGGVSGAKASGEAVYNSLAKTLDVMGDQSVLKNLARFADRAKGETFGQITWSFMKAVGLDVPSSFVPSLARQARQVVDPMERDTRAEQRGGFSGFVEEAKNRALAQLPGVSERFPTRPSLLTGKDRKTALGEMETPGRTLAQFSPANVSTFTPRPVAREIARLNREGESVTVAFPAPKKGEPTSNLRGRERRFAQAFARMSNEMIADVFYKDADNEMKAAAWNGLKRHLANMGKEDFEEKTIEEIVEDAIEAVERRREKEEEK